MAFDQQASVIAKLLNLTPRRVQQLVANGIIPGPINHLYDPFTCIHGYIAYLKKQIKEQGVPGLVVEQMRRTRIDADMREIKLQEAKKQVVRIETVIHEWTKLFEVFKTRIRSIPRKLAPFLASETDAIRVENLMQKDIDDVLEVLGNYDPSRTYPIPREYQAGSKARKAAAEADRKRVGGPKQVRKPKSKLGAGSVAD